MGIRSPLNESGQRTYVNELNGCVINTLSMFNLSDKVSRCVHIESLFDAIFDNMAHCYRKSCVNKTVTTLGLRVEIVTQFYSRIIGNKRENNRKQVILIAACVV